MSMRGRLSLVIAMLLSMAFIEFTYAPPARAVVPSILGSANGSTFLGTSSIYHCHRKDAGDDKCSLAQSGVSSGEGIIATVQANECGGCVGNMTAITVNDSFSDTWRLAFKKESDGAASKQAQLTFYTNATSSGVLNITAKSPTGLHGVITINGMTSIVFSAALSYTHQSGTGDGSGSHPTTLLIGPMSSQAFTANEIGVLVSGAANCGDGGAANQGSAGSYTMSQAGAAFELWGGYGVYNRASSWQTDVYIFNSSSSSTFGVTAHWSSNCSPPSTNGYTDITFFNAIAPPVSVTVIVPCTWYQEQCWVYPLFFMGLFSTFWIALAAAARVSTRGMTYVLMSSFTYGTIIEIMMGMIGSQLLVLIMVADVLYAVGLSALF
jgi:hypothetical protein